MQTNREAGADLVRAVACLMVICHHLLQRLDPSELPPGAKDVVAFGLTGSFGVAAFFVLSGYLLSRPFWQQILAGGEMPPISVFTLRRAARIAPAFWLSLTVSFVIGVTLLGKPFSDFNLMRYGAGFLFLGGWHWSTLFPVDDNGPLWSIGLEVASYLFLALSMIGLFRSGIGGRKTLAAWLGLIVAVLAIDWLVVNYWPVDQTGAGWDHGLMGGAKAWMPRYNPISLFAIFAIGVLAGGIRSALPGRPHSLADLAALSGFGLAIAAMASAIYGPTEGYGFLGIPYRYPWFPAGVAIALIAMPRSLWLGQLADNQFVAFIARISFGLYLWHYLMLELIAGLWPPNVSYGQWLLVCVTVVATSTAIATASFYLLEQPIIRWARTLERRPARSLPVAVAEGA